MNNIIDSIFAGVISLILSYLALIDFNISKNEYFYISAALFFALKIDFTLTRIAKNSNE